MEEQKVRFNIEYNGIYIGYTTAATKYHAIELCYSKQMHLFPDRSKYKAIKKA